jgi:ribose 1,5-bisphosphokinase PhnN
MAMMRRRMNMRGREKLDEMEERKETSMMMMFNMTMQGMMQMREKEKLGKMAMMESMMEKEVHPMMAWSERTKLPCTLIYNTKTK